MLSDNLNYFLLTISFRAAYWVTAWWAASAIESLKGCVFIWESSGWLRSSSVITKTEFVADADPDFDVTGRRKVDAVFLSSRWPVKNHSFKVMSAGHVSGFQEYHDLLRWWTVRKCYPMQCWAFRNGTVDCWQQSMTILWSSYLWDVKQYPLRRMRGSKLFTQTLCLNCGLFTSCSFRCHAYVNVRTTTSFQQLLFFFGTTSSFDGLLSRLSCFSFFVIDCCTTRTVSKSLPLILLISDIVKVITRIVTQDCNPGNASV